MRILYAFIIYLLLTASFSCRKITSQTTCPGLGSSTTSNQVIPSTEKAAPVLFAQPRFNPSNSNEIIFYLVNNDKGTRHLVKYNLVSKAMTKLIEGPIDGQPDWNKNSWILFNHGDNRIWKIKDNGDSLTMITDGRNGIETDAIWSKQTNNFAYATSKGSFIANTSGVVIDTLPFYIDNSSWSYDDSKITFWGHYLPGSSDPSFGYYDLQTTQFHVLPSQGANSFSTDWFPDSKNIVWAGDPGIFKTDLQGNTVKLTTDCKNKLYLWPSVSADGSKIIYQCVYQTAIENNTIYNEVDLYMINANGTDDHKIEINYK